MNNNVTLKPGDKVIVTLGYSHDPYIRAMTIEGTVDHIDGGVAFVQPDLATGVNTDAAYVPEVVMISLNVVTQTPNKKRKVPIRNDPYTS